MRLEFLKAGGFEIALYEWGDPEKPAVLCLHGLGGSGLNFRIIGEFLSHEYHILAPDLIGRGRSEWSPAPSTDYCFSRYEEILLDLLEQKGIGELDWIGVSMGGALGIRMAGGVLRGRVRSLTLNDIGPRLDPLVAETIRTSVNTELEFASFASFLDHYKSLFSRLGMVPSEKRSWQDIALDGARRGQGGCWTFHFDPQVAEQLRHSLQDYGLAGEFAAISAPIQVFWGVQSEVLREADISGMILLQPGLRVCSIDNVGHAPLLDRESDLDTIRAFLEEAGRKGEGAL